MDEGQIKEVIKPVERRRGNERRLKPRNPDPSRRRIQVLLARLISVFIGGLVGFLVAYVISSSFVEQWRTADLEAQRIVEEADDELQQVEPDFSTAQQLYRKHYDEFTVPTAEGSPGNKPLVISELPGEAATATGEDFAVPPVVSETESAPGELPDSASQTPEASPPATIDEPADGVITRAEFLVISRNYSRLKNHRQRLLDRGEFWELERAEYRRKIDLLNALGIVIVIVFVLIGYLFYPLTLLGIRRLAGQLELLMSGFEQRAAQATVGFFAGLVIAVVILLAVFNMFGGETTVLSYPWFRLVFGAFVVVVTGICGSLVGVSYFGPVAEDDPYKEYRGEAAPKVLDTSVIIDGRVHEIGTTGFLGGKLVVTNSVLRELQTMADSANERKRSKGRRGLELLRKMQDDPRVEIVVYDDSAFDIQAKGTDEQLILVGQAMDGWVVTNDYNLNRVAAIRDVRVININALANAVKTTHLPGDEIEIAIIDRGKQRGQGVGYLDDGTMVVVEDGEPFVGKTKMLRITSVSQTVQGRLLFGRVDLAQE